MGKEAAGEEMIVITEQSKAFFHNNVDFCVGTGRMGLALTQEYMDQLRLVQEEIGFRHIRGHGLFCDDMAIYQEYEEDGVKKAEYNFTYLDRVMDAYRSVGIRPFLELGFMPYKMARGTQTLFYWKGNTTPPADYDAWCQMVQALLRHLMERYGTDEVVTWPIEVWNEPNLPGFWENADMQEYFKLFHRTFDAVKAVDKRFQVGGPAICGVRDEEWMQAFLEYCRDNKLAIDSVTRHHYTIDLPEEIGHYAYSELIPAEDGFANLQTSRDIIDSFAEYKGLPMHITEFNTSYTPKGVIHDTNLNAAAIARQLSRLGDVNESYSYWTFGDVFEETGVPFTPFHGGFGLVANGCIPKPTFWTFAFFKKLKEGGGTCVYKDDNMVLMKREDGSFRGVAWNIVEHAETVSAQELADQNTETDAEQDVDRAVKKAAKKAARKIKLSLPASGGYCLLTKTVDEKTCNPLKVWHDLGEPASLSKEQRKLLVEAAKPLIRTKRKEAEDGQLCVKLTLERNAVVYFEVQPGEVRADRGYEYERIMR